VRGTDAGGPMTAARRASADRRRDHLQRQIESVAAVHDAAPFGVGAWTGAGQLVYANPVFCGLLGAGQSDLIGVLFDQFIDPADAPRVAEGVGALWRRRRNHFTVELRCADPDGAVVWLLAHVGPVYAAHGEPAYVLSTIYDFEGSRTAPSERSPASVAPMSSDESSDQPSESGAPEV
jgi:PAS domain S-box-containing protein